MFTRNNSKFINITQLCKHSIKLAPLLRADHPNNIKRPASSIYFKRSLPLIKINNIMTKKEFLVTVIEVIKST